MAKVLIIDDDILVTQLLEAYFKDSGHEVTVTHRGEEGMAEALKAVPDIILLDVILPDATGFQMCSQLRKTPATQFVPIIMMTGFAIFPNQQIFGLERGANEYVLKPFKVAELGELVKGYVGSTRNNDAVHRAAGSPSTPKAAGNGSEDLSQLRNFLKQAISERKKEI